MTVAKRLLGPVVPAKFGSGAIGVPCLPLVSLLVSLISEVFPGLVIRGPASPRQQSKIRRPCVAMASKEAKCPVAREGTALGQACVTQVRGAHAQSPEVTDGQAD